VPLVSIELIHRRRKSHFAWLTRPLDYGANKMYKIVYTIILLLIFNSCNADNTKDDINKTKDANLPSCKIEKIIPINFKNVKSNDKLYISVIGSPCYKAILTIKIISEDNKVLYEYIQPFKKHVATQWDDPNLVADANNFVNHLIKNHSVSASNLPPFSSSEAEAETPVGFEYTITINKEFYKNIIKSNKPIFSHPTHYEAWRYIVYDEKINKGIIILEAGL
jgi:hypothetical protein